MANRRGVRSRIPYALHLVPWLGATLRVFVGRSWILLTVVVIPLILLPATFQLFTPILVVPVPLALERATGTAWLHAALGLLPPSLAVTLAAVLAPAALRRERWPSAEVWQQAILRFPLVYVSVLGLGLLSSLPAMLLRGNLAFLVWMLLVVGLVIQVRCSLAPVILVTKRTSLVTSFRASMRLTRHNTGLMLGGYFLLGAMGALVLGLAARWLRGPVFWGSRAPEVPVLVAVVHGALLNVYAVAAAVAWNDLDAPHREQQSEAVAQVFD